LDDHANITNATSKYSVKETNITTRKTENRKCRKHVECNIIAPLAKEIAGKANAQK